MPKKAAKIFTDHQGCLIEPRYSVTTEQTGGEVEFSVPGWHPSESKRQLLKRVDIQFHQILDQYLDDVEEAMANGATALRAHEELAAMVKEGKRGMLRK